MKTEIEHLLTPRYKVIAPYPHMELAVGDIIHQKSENTYIRADKTPRGGVFIEGIEKYPHLFSPLAWWAHREADELPKYIKSQTKVVSPVWELIEWNDRTYWQANDPESARFGLGVHFNLSVFEPATEEEYLTHKTQQNEPSNN